MAFISFAFVNIKCFVHWFQPLPTLIVDKSFHKEEEAGHDIVQQILLPQEESKQGQEVTRP